MKNNFKFYVCAILFSILFTACSDDDDDVTPAPSVANVEIGHGNNKTGYVGGDLHIDASIDAPGTIANVRVEIHPESGAGWEFEEVYTDGFAGLKNAKFHKHIDIPANAATGSYHFHMVVTDNNGQTTKVEEEIEVVHDPSLPSVSGLEIELAHGGAEIHVETTITAPNKIAKVEVEVHGGTWEKEFSYTDAAMVGQTTYKFHKHVHLSDAPAGHYHLHFKVIDQAGKERELEGHFDKP